MDIAGAIAAATQAFGLVRELSKLDQDLDRAELKGKLAEVTSALADVKFSLVEAQEEIHKRDTEISELKAATKKRADLVEHDGMMYDAFEDGRPKGRPYCPNCLVDGKFSYIIREPTGGNHSCRRCKSHYAWIAEFDFE